MKCVRNFKGLPATTIELFFLYDHSWELSFQLSRWCSVLFYVVICAHGELQQCPSLKNKQKQSPLKPDAAKAKIHNFLHILGETYLKWVLSCTTKTEKSSMLFCLAITDMASWNVLNMKMSFSWNFVGEQRMGVYSFSQFLVIFSSFFLTKDQNNK